MELPNRLLHAFHHKSDQLFIRFCLRRLQFGRCFDCLLLPVRIVWYLSGSRRHDVQCERRLLLSQFDEVSLNLLYFTLLCSTGSQMQRHQLWQMGTTWIQL